MFPKENISSVLESAGILLVDPLGIKSSVLSPLKFPISPLVRLR